MTTETAARFRVASLSETGWRRSLNQDRLVVRPLAGDALLLAVADGMGGHVGGEIAAQIAVDTLAAMARISGDEILLLMEAMEEAGARVLAEAERRPELRGMGCTLTAALADNGRLSWGQVGDSRLYLYRQGGLRQITTDQNLAWSLVAAGRLTPEEARISPYRHLLDQCVGCLSCRPASGSLELRPGDWLLLSTDGLHGELPAASLAGILMTAGEPDRAVLNLVQAALDAGGNDNITAVLAEFQG